MIICVCYLLCTFQLAVLEAEFKQMKAENRRLKQALNQVTGVVPRQFMDLGPASNNGGEADEPPSSSEERRSGSAGKINGHDHVGREDSPADRDQQSQGNWRQSKVPRTTSSADQSAKDNDQTEATMRKARVSVRARSEAPMVLYIHTYMHTYIHTYYGICLIVFEFVTIIFLVLFIILCVYI